MQKDVIYIDTEDDITTIIGKIKDSKAKIIALVPPKRTGVIQSAVNLKLVHRSAEQSDKRIVIVSNNAALMKVANLAGIPVAKTLQSKPELAEISTLEVDDDVIDGSELLSKNTQNKTEKNASSEKINDEDTDNTNDEMSKTDSKPKKSIPAHNKIKVPNFDKFRNKLFLIIGTGALVIAFFVWALVFAPNAKVVITAKSSTVSLNSSVTIGDALTTDLNQSTIKSVTKDIKKDISKQISATGRKDVGAKATGVVRLDPTRDTLVSVRVDDTPVTIPAGTKVLSKGEMAYVTDSTVVYNENNYRAVNVGVTAIESGSKYNGASGAAGKSPAGTNATFVQATSGGTDKIISVLQQSDVDSARSKLIDDNEIESMKKSLKEQFNDEYILVESSFKVDMDGVKPSPAVDTEATDGKATLAGSIVYSVKAIQKNELSKYLDDYYKQQVDGKSDQKVYSNGLKTISLTNVNESNGVYSLNINANGKIGPKISENKLKEYIKGKRLGEIQSYVEKIDGVTDVDIKFSPFWVKKAPRDVNHIKIEFKVDG